LRDASYQLLTTDIYGSRNATGVLINIKGQVVGIITQDYNSEDMQNLIYAYGISSIRQLVQNLLNGDERVHLGLYLSEVPQEAIDEAGLPSGVYITDIEINTPAMNYGLAKGDVITMIGNKQITSVNSYMQAVSELKPGDVITVTYARLSNGIYKSMKVDIEIDGGI
ncbi:MAG: PDZ domain-containing protein, partial [Lachnospiraceae bacterium]|nr:PDZ domain-containing protein [Lachnospiraceae bacterium]